MAEVPPKLLTLKTRTIVLPPHKMTSKGEAGWGHLDLDPLGWLHLEDLYRASPTQMTGWRPIFRAPLHIHWVDRVGVELS